MLNFLKTMDPGTRTAIFVLGSKLRFIQGFTSDSSRLVAAINDKKNSVSPEKDASFYSSSDAADDANDIRTLQSMLGGSGRATGGIDAAASAQGALAGIQYGQRVQMTFEALGYLARYLGGIPGRKNLIWFASSFPVTIFPTVAQRQQMSYQRIYASAVKETADLLTVAKVAVYPINAQGMMNDHPMEADHNFEQAGKGPALMANISAGSDEHAGIIMGMEQLAADTGGKAFYNTNDLNGAMRHAINDGSHYYTLVYTPANKKMDGRYRRIEVKLASGHYKLSYRRGYNADDPKILALQKPDDSDPLRPLLMRGLPSVTQVLYGVRVTPARPQPAPDAKHAGQNAKLTGAFTRYSIDFLVRWSDVAFTAAANNAHAGKIQVGLMAYDRNGEAVNWQGGTQEMNLTPAIFASIQKSGIPAHMEIDLPSTDVFLETGIYDWGSGKAGTLEIPLRPETAAPAAPPHSSN
jgi:VWFA-related protein